LFPDAQHILDYYHLYENANTYAKYLFNTDQSKYKPWAKDIYDKLRAGEYRQVLKELTPFKYNNPSVAAPSKTVTK